jgi:hypothetical protein
MSNADDFNEAELHAGRIKPAHLSELTARFQAEQGMSVDGMLGPKTRAMVELLRGREPSATIPGRAASTVPVMHREAFTPQPDLSISAAGWLSGVGVEVVPIHRTRYYPHLATIDGLPRAIVAHYTATDHGTARAMAKRLVGPLDTQPVEVDGDPADRQVSWHVSVEGDGTIVQMAPLLVGCWHAGGRTAKPIPGVGPANKTAIGIELVGHGDAFPAVQVEAARRVWRALVRAYSIPRGPAMVTHESLDPTRKKDPGEVFMSQHAPGVLEYAYAPR